MRGGLHFIYGNRHENHQLGKGSFPTSENHISYKDSTDCNDSTPYIVLRGCYNTVPNLHAPTDKSDNSRDSSYKEFAGIQSLS
jgi:hypothetical protein